MKKLIGTELRQILILSLEPVNESLETEAEAEVCLGNVNIMVCMIMTNSIPYSRDIAKVRYGKFKGEGKG